MKIDAIRSSIRSVGMGAAGTIAVLAAVSARAEPGSLSGEIALVLEGGLGHGSNGTPLEVFAQCRDGKVVDVWANCRHYNQNRHYGMVQTSDVSAAAVRFGMDLVVRRDNFVHGGWGTYEVDVKRKDLEPRPGTGETGYYGSEHPVLRTGIATGALEGEFKGVFDGHRGKYKYRGRAVGIVLPLRVASPGFVPPQEGEHPRLMFRRSELPALREKMKTPLGKAIADALARNLEPISLGMMYQLTGRASHAEVAIPVVERLMAESGGSEILKTLTWGQRVNRAAIAYDLCHDAWPAEFRQKVEKHLYGLGNATLNSPWTFCDPHSHMILAPGAPHVNGMFPGAGMAALALLGIKGPEPEFVPPPEPPKRPDPGTLPPWQRAVKLPDEAEVRARYELSRERLRREWIFDRDAWLSSGGADVRYLRFAAQTHQSLALNFLYSMGEGGFQGSGEGQTLMWNQIMDNYAVAYRNVFGRTVTGRPDMSHFVPRYVMTTVWRTGGPLNQSFGGGAGIPGPNFMSRAMPLCPEEWKPAVMWYWLKVLGVSAEDAATEAGAAKAVRKIGDDPLALVHTYVSFPLDAASGKPTVQPKNPAEVLPRVWEAKTRGFYCFRNAWEGDDDIVAQMHANQGPGVGWGLPEAGDIQIYGLGHEWIKKGSLGDRTWRAMNNVVVLPEDEVLEGAGRVTWFRADAKTGSGVVTVNLDGVYERRRRSDASAEGEETGAPGRPADTAIRGLRAFGVDYSGRAGAPAVFAIVDKVEGGRTKEWVYHIPDGKTADVAGNVLTVKAGDRSMRAVFAAPAVVRNRCVAGSMLSAGGKTGPVSLNRNAIHFSGADPTAGEFFVVVTLQRGDAPPIRVEGSGLDAKVTAGEQCISFDGEKVVFAR